MSYTMTLEPEVVRNAQACALRKGVSLDSLVRTYLISLVQQESQGERLSQQLDAYVRGLPKLKGRSYRFHRADAYDETLS